METTLPVCVKKTLRKFVHNGLYLFPDGHVYVAQRPAMNVSWCWRFYTLDNWFTNASILSDTYHRWPNGEWRKSLRSNSRQAAPVSEALNLDDIVLFTNTVLAKKTIGKRTLQPDREWYWKLTRDQREFRTKKNER